MVRVSKYEEVVPDQDAEKGYTAGGPTTFDVEATMLANKIKVAEETTAEKVKEHERVLKRTDVSFPLFSNHTALSTASNEGLTLLHLP